MYTMTLDSLLMLVVIASITMFIVYVIEKEIF